MFSKICPSCQGTQTYSSKQKLFYALDHNIICRVCSFKKINDHRSPTTELTKSKMRLAQQNRRKQENKIPFSKLSKGRLKTYFHYWFKHYRKNGFEHYVELSPLELKLWLSSQFKKGMSWENYGRVGWHIDHKIPLCSFDLTQDKNIKKAWHYTNLKPLWAKENQSKGSKIVYMD